MISVDEIEAITGFFEEHNLSFYVHGSFAMTLHGLYDELDDVDFRIPPEKEELLLKLKNLFPERVTVHFNKKWSGGIYGGICVNFKGKTKIDVCAQICQLNDLGKTELPFERNEDLQLFHYKSLELPTASLESLLAYYLILRRTGEGKNDLLPIQKILSSPKFNEQKFFSLLERIENKDKLRAVYEEFKTRFS